MVIKFYLILFMMISGSLSVLADAGPARADEATPAPTPIQRWKQYTNQKYGFSVSYPMGAEAKELEENQGNTFAEFQLNLPTYFGNDEIHLLPFTDFTIQKWNDFVDEGRAGGDAEGFGYSLEKFRKYLALPVGSLIKDIPRAEISEIAGMKAISIQSNSKTDEVISTVFNFILLGEKRWLCIVWEHNDRTYDEKRHEFKYKSKNILQREMVAQEAILKTLKFFKPIVKNLRKSN